MPQTGVGPYLIGRLLGEGGQGRCYEGRHPKSGKSVAIKVVEWDVHAPSAEHQRGRIQREIAYLQRKRIPGVVRLLDSGELPPSPELARGAAYLVYELVGDGTTLRDRLLTSPAPSICDVVGACCELGHTLRDLAKRKIFHRDIKPQNIAFRGADSWDPVLIDFGIARAADATTITSTGKLWGSPFYSPPEWRGLPPSPALHDLNWSAWDSYSFARTAAVALAVALGRRLDQVEYLSNRELLSLLRRHTPRTADALKEALQDDPSARPDLKDVCLGLAALDLDITIGDDLATRAVLKHTPAICSAIETRLGRPLVHKVRRDRLGYVELTLHPKGTPNAPHLRLGSSFFLGSPSLTLQGSALTGHRAGRRNIPDHFSRWAKRNRQYAVVLDVGLKHGDGIEKLIMRALKSARRYPSKELSIAWEVHSMEHAHVYERLSVGDAAPIDALLGLWKVLLA